MSGAGLLFFGGQKILLPAGSTNLGGKDLLESDVNDDSRFILG